MPFEETFLAMYEEPEAVQAFFEAMVNYKIKLMDIVFKKYAPVDYIIWGDDWGTQRAGFFSNSMFREFIMPYTKRCWDWVHAQGKFVELHSCGLTQQYINEFVEMGLDAWTPQAINDLDMLTAKYGDKIALTVNIPGINEARTEAEARALVRKFVDTYAPRGKVIAGMITNPDEKVKTAAFEALYNDSSEFYAKH
jgi:uroporphyrinogen-III decarboxylase